MQTIVNNIPITSAKLPKPLYMRPATLYYLRLEFPSTVADNSNRVGMGWVGNNATSCGNGNGNGNVLYKLGYTTTALSERVHGRPTTYKSKWVGNKRKVLRYNGHKGMGLPPGTQVYVVSTYRHRNAALVYAWEQYLHAQHSRDRWQGLPLMANGNTELYVRDILGLELDW